MLSLPEVRRRITLEHELECELNDARVVHRAVDHAETRSRVNVLHPAGTTRQVELRVVPGIEELSAEIQAHALVRQREMLDEREVRVYKSRPVDRSTVGVSKFSGWG